MIWVEGQGVSVIGVEEYGMSVIGVDSRVCQ